VDDNIMKVCMSHEGGMERYGGHTFCVLIVN
jgi:hypothetical protein